MCTPEELRFNCSCPHMLARGVRRTWRWITTAAAGVAMWALFQSGYGWALAVAAWVALMGAAALVSASRARARAVAVAGVRSQRTATAPPRRRTTRPGDGVPVAVPVGVPDRLPELASRR